MKRWCFNVQETVVVEAETEEQALEILNEGDAKYPVIDSKDRDVMSCGEVTD